MSTLKYLIVFPIHLSHWNDHKTGGGRERGGGRKAGGGEGGRRCEKGGKRRGGRGGEKEGERGRLPREEWSHLLKGKKVPIRGI